MVHRGQQTLINNSLMGNILLWVTENTLTKRISVALWFLEQNLKCRPEINRLHVAEISLNWKIVKKMLPWKQVCSRHKLVSILVLWEKRTQYTSLDRYNSHLPSIRLDVHDYHIQTQWLYQLVDLQQPKNNPHDQFNSRISQITQFYNVLTIQYIYIQIQV